MGFRLLLSKTTNLFLSIHVREAREGKIRKLFVSEAKQNSTDWDASKEPFELQLQEHSIRLVNNQFFSLHTLPEYSAVGGLTNWSITVG